MYVARSEDVPEIRATKTRIIDGKEVYIKRQCIKPWPAVSQAMIALGQEATFVLWYQDEDGSNRKGWTLNTKIVRRIMAAILRWAPDQHKRSVWFDLRPKADELHRLLAAESVTDAELRALYAKYSDVPNNSLATQVDRDMAAMVGYAIKVINPHMRANRLVVDTFSPYLGDYPVPTLSAFIDCAARVAAAPVSSNFKNRSKQVKGVVNDELIRVMQRPVPGRKSRIPVSQQQLELPGMAVVSP